MKRLPSTSLIALAASAALLLASCATTPPSPDSTVEPVSDGEFTLYSGRDEALIQPLIDQFEEGSGISVDVRYGNTAKLGALLLEESDRTPAQVFLAQDAGALGALANADLFAELPDEITDRVPEGFTSTDDRWGRSDRPRPRDRVRRRRARRD